VSYGIEKNASLKSTDAAAGSSGPDGSTKALGIGELAQRTGVSRDTLRHYDRLGLLPSTMRTRAGYRRFPAASVDRVALIREAVRVGFSLRQLSAFLRVRQTGGAPCHDVRDAAAHILESVDQRIADLTSTRDAIRAMLDEWDARLAGTPPGRPAHLLDSLHAAPRGDVERPISNLKRPR
jgi:DNA-binding transcriptional MerR regulator